MADRPRHRHAVRRSGADPAGGSELLELHVSGLESLADRILQLSDVGQAGQRGGNARGVTSVQVATSNRSSSPSHDGAISMKMSRPPSQSSSVMPAICSALISRSRAHVSISGDALGEVLAVDQVLSPVVIDAPAPPPASPRRWSGGRLDAALLVQKLLDHHQLDHEIVEILHHFSLSSPGVAMPPLILTDDGFTWAPSGSSSNRRHVGPAPCAWLLGMGG